MLAQVVGGGVGLGAKSPSPQERESTRRETVVVSNKPEERIAGATKVLGSSAVPASPPDGEEVRRVSESKTPMSAEEARNKGLTDDDGTVLDFAELARGSS